MSRRAKVWFVIATLFTIGNLAAAWFVARTSGDVRHAGTHLLLGLVGAFFTWRIVARSGSEPAMDSLQTDAQLQRLQESVDAIALEVERIGEAQRFMTKIAAEKIEPAPPKNPP
jgi:hypothetical protein